MQQTQALGQQAVRVWSLVPAPVIAALHGHVLGGGLQLALGADIRIAAPATRLSVKEIDWGLIPDMAGTQLLPDLVGRDVAKELTFTGRTIDGTEALSIGLVTRLAADPQTEASGLATQIAEKSSSAIRRAKHLLDIAVRVPLADGLDAEQEAIARLIADSDLQSAITTQLREVKRI